MNVSVTVQVGPKRVAASEVSDARVRSQLSAAGKEVGSKLAAVRCSIHDKGPTNVRIHFDKNGSADLAYDSCCEALAPLVSKALG